MAIKCAFTNNGTLLGDFEESLTEGEWVVTNPVMLTFQPNNIALFPLLSTCEENSLRITKDEIRFGQVFTPNVELRNHYSNQFGSGIQLITS